MNDEQLDSQLRQLFEADRRTIDPKDTVATALLESITGEVDVADSVDSSDRNVASPSFEGDVISLLEPTPQLNRGRILVAAAVTLAVVLGIGRLFLPFSVDSPVISDDVDNFDDLEVNGAVEIVPDGFIEGPAVPIVLINRMGNNPDPILECLATGAEEDFGIPNEGSAVLGTVHGSVGEADPNFLDGPTATVVAVVDAVTTKRCETFGHGGSAGVGPSFDESWTPDPVVVLSVLNSNEAGVMVGRLNGDVSQITLTDVPLDRQSWEPFSFGWFRVDFPAESNLALEITLQDGEAIETHADLLTDSPDAYRCFRVGCVDDAFESLREEAMEAGALRQAGFLESGVLSQAEYDSAQGAFVACVEAVIDLDSPTTILERGTEDADAAQACYDAEITFLERARLQQNGITGFEGVDQGAEELIAEEDPLVTEARLLFGGGLSREELEELWNGYPYADVERGDRIDAYLQDFAWMREGIVVEVSLFEQFAGSGNFTPIVSAQSLQDRNLAAAFVLGVVDDQVVIRRLPEAGSETFSTFDDLSNTVSTSLRGVEGGVAAFLEGVELEAIPNDDGEGTTFLLPSDYQWESVVTIVGATPEEPGAAVVVLN